MRPHTVVVDSREAFECLIEDTAIEVELRSETAKLAYLEADWRLHLQICKVMGLTIGYERSDRLVWLPGDFWPTQTKHIVVDTTAFGSEQAKALRRLLQGGFQGWRITICIYRDFGCKEPEYIGGIAIYAMKTIVQRDTLRLLRWLSRV